MYTLGRMLVAGATQLIYPNTCWTCGVLMPPDQGPVCSLCHPRLTVDPFPACPRCSSTVGPHLVLDAGCPECSAESLRFTGAFRLGPYDGMLREAILRMKRWSGEDLAEVLARLWAKPMADRLTSLNVGVVVPVPLHWLRRWRRGFNASDLLASALARELGVPCWPGILRRVKATAPQVAQKNATARKENVKRAFRVRPGFELAGKTVVLVDDVLTTGATANSAARALRVLKPRAIYVAVLAHGK